MRIIKADVCAWMNLMNSVQKCIYCDIFSPSLYKNKCCVYSIGKINIF